MGAIFRNGTSLWLELRGHDHQKSSLDGVQTFHHLTFIHPTVNHGHLINGHLMMQIFYHADTLAPDMRSRRRLITFKFNYRDTLSHSQVSQEKSHNVKTSKISVYLCDKYAIPLKYTKISLREYRDIALATHSFTD